MKQILPIFIIMLAGPEIASAATAYYKCANDGQAYYDLADSEDVGPEIRGCRRISRAAYVRAAIAEKRRVQKLLEDFHRDFPDGWPRVK